MKRIIDLTMPLIPGMRGVEFETAKTIEKNGWNAKTLHLYSHCGTHVDAPCHFIPNGKTLDSIPIEKFRATARLAEIKDVVAQKLITVKDLGELADAINPGEALILKTGWSKIADTPEYREKLPRVSKDLAEWCVKKGVSILGVEPPSVADVNNLKELTTVHQILLKAGIIIVESLYNLEKLNSNTFEFLVFPIPILGGDGAPARAIAFEN